MMDEEMLGDISNNKKRRKWNDVDRLSKPIHDVDENERLMDPVIEDDPEQPKVEYRKRRSKFSFRLLKQSERYN